MASIRELLLRWSRLKDPEPEQQEPDDRAGQRRLQARMKRGVRYLSRSGGTASIFMQPAI